MKTGNRIMSVALAAGWLWTVGARAGEINPTNPPGPTMHTLEEIYQKLLSAEQSLADMEQRMQSAGLTQVPSGMALIPAGSFVMGATTNVGHESYVGEKPQHLVLASAFFMDKHEVTKVKWDLVYAWATNNGYAFANAGMGLATNYPIRMVNWYDVIKWCNARSQMEGLTPCYTVTGMTYRTDTITPDCDFRASGYRLPTEAEWERAARGGASYCRFPWGDTIQHARANYYSSSSYAYDTSPTRNYHPDYAANGAAPVGSFAPNGYGLYDMAGNSSEWCWDFYDSAYYSSSPGLDPTGPITGPNRVLRGGSWALNASCARCCYRGYNEPGGTDVSYGFRCVRAR
jgi:sulfatase modifying factor 1